MYIRGLIPRNFAELAEAVPIERNGSAHDISVLVASASSECSNEYAHTRSLIKAFPSHMHMYVEVENDSNIRPLALLDIHFAHHLEHGSFRNREKNCNSCRCAAWSWLNFSVYIDIHVVLIFFSYSGPSGILGSGGRQNIA